MPCLLIVIFNKNHNVILIYRLSFTVRHYICVVKWTESASLFLFTAKLKDCQI